MATVRPTGTVAFLFTDIEGSTRSWEDASASMSAAVARHDALLRSVFGAHGGYVFKALGDAFCVAFDTVGDAVAAASAAQAALASEAWPDGVPVKVRMAVHAGTTVERDGDYFGPTLNRTARLMAAGHGGQTLLSLAAHELVQGELPDHAALLDLGAHRLKDLARPERVYQLLIAGLPDTFPALRTLDRTPNNLPQQATSLVGRADELAEIGRLLGRARLVTLLGPAGTGKTRLSLQAAADSLDRHPEGAWFVDLSTVVDETQVDAATARALGLREEVGRPIRRTLLEHLAKRNLLLILDNCEHVVNGAADLAAEITVAASDVRLIATSREMLRVPGEHVYAVPPLRLPDRRAAVPPDSMALDQYESVRLFIDRAEAVQPTFVVTRENAPAVAEICVRLDGIPLAIELAAVRVRMMTPAQILARLDDRFRLLTGGSRTAQGRQQTLEGAIAWSYDLLGDAERTVLDRLSVFRSGWTLDAAENVVADDEIAPYDVLEHMASLVDKSLVTVDDHERTTRYRLLESVRAYARPRLDTSGAAEAVRGRRDAYFVAFVEEAGSHLPGPQMGEWLTRLEAEFDDLAAALDHAVRCGDVETALRLVVAQWWSWYSRGYLGEGRTWLADVLAMPGADEWPRLVARANHGCGVLANHQSDYGSARRHLDVALARYRETGDVQGAGNVLTDIGITAWGRGDLTVAEEAFEASLAMWRGRNEPTKIAKGLNNLGIVAESRGDYARARELYAEALAIHRTTGDPWSIAHALGNIGGVVRFLGDLPEARRMLVEALAIKRGLNDRSTMAFLLRVLGEVEADAGEIAAAEHYFADGFGLATEIGDRGEMIQLLEGSARVAELRADARRTLVLLSAVGNLRERLAIARAPGDEPTLAALGERARAALAAHEAAAATAEGRAMGIDEAVAFAAGGWVAADTPATPPVPADD